METMTLAKEPFKKRILILLTVIFILALGLRFLAFLKYKDYMELSGDARNYWLMSHQLADTGIYGYWYDGNPYGGTPGVSNARVTPGYPLLMTAVYKIVGNPWLQITAMRLLQIVMGSLTAILGYFFVKKLFGKDWAGVLTAFLIAIYPPYILSSTLILTEASGLFTMLLYFCMAAIAFDSGKKLHHAFAGLAFGIHIMIRPTLLPLFILPFVYLLLNLRFRKEGDKGAHTDKATYDFKRILQAFLLQLAGFLAIMLPWWIRNVITLGALILTAKGEGNALLAGTYPYWIDFWKDVPEEIKGVNDAQRTFGIQRILKGLQSDFWLYVKWFTLGKTDYMFAKPYLVHLLPELDKLQFHLHKGILFTGVMGMIWHSIRHIKGLGFYLYGLVILGLQLLFVPDPRYAYQLMLFIIIGAAWILGGAGEWIWGRINSVRKGGKSAA